MRRQEYISNERTKLQQKDKMNLRSAICQDKELKAMVIMMLTGLEKEKMDKLNENFNKENIKKKQMKNSITEMKNILERISRLEDTDEQISDLEGR